MSKLTDYSSDLQRLASLATEPDALDELLAQALKSLRRIVPYDLAALYELSGSGDELMVRVTEGPLVSERVRGHRLSLRQFPTIRAAMATRRPIPLEAHQHEREGDPYDGILDLPPGHSCMVVPLFAASRELGIITLDRVTCGTYAQEAVDLAAVYGQLVSIAMVYAQQTALLERYRHTLKEENRLLREELRGDDMACRLVRALPSASMQAVARHAEQVAHTSMPVLITGETGTGKEVLAHAIHAWSPRVDAPFVKLNCAAIPENLVESELFGYVRGAFSGASTDRPGRFLTANGGTLFLDEIGDMPLAVQGKLLRVLQEGTFEPVGSDRTVRVDVRVIAATHVDLPAAVRQRTFREDLYFRIAVFPLHLPPLRSRPDDIVPLAQMSLEQIARRRGLGPWTLGADAAASLAGRDFRGNVRELVNVLERAAILRASGELRREDVEGGAFGPAPPTEVVYERPPDAASIVSLEENERRHLERALARAGGRIYGKGGAAALLGVPPTTLQSKLARHGIRRN